MKNSRIIAVQPEEDLHYSCILRTEIEVQNLLQKCDKLVEMVLFLHIQRPILFAALFQE